MTLILRFLYLWRTDDMFMYVHFIKGRFIGEYSVCLNKMCASVCLLLQDRSVCVAVSTLRPLLFDNGDVLVAGSFSAMTVAHIAVAASARSVRVLVCGADHTPSHIEDIQELLTQMDLKSEW